MADLPELPDTPWDKLPGLSWDEELCERPEQPAGKMACLAWVKEQSVYRERIRSLFRRDWHINLEAVSSETEAGFAWDALTEFQRKSILLPRPSGLPLSKYRTHPDSVEFEILIPWQILPPASSLTIDRIRLAVRASGLATYGNSSGEPPPQMSVSPPIVSHITPCEQPLTGQFIGTDSMPAFYFLNASHDIREVFFFENPRRDPWALVPSEKDISPVVSELGFFTQTLGPGEFFCSPYMTYRKGSDIRPLGGDLWPWEGGSAKLPVKRLASGTLLIRIGPIAYFGPLWTKAFFEYPTKIIAVTPKLDIHEALTLWSRSDMVDGYEVEVSEDWRTVTEFKKNLDHWSSQAYCLTGDTYESCGKNPNSPPPKKRVLTHN